MVTFFAFCFRLIIGACLLSVAGAVGGLGLVLGGIVLVFSLIAGLLRALVG